PPGEELSINRGAVGPHPAEKGGSTMKLTEEDTIRLLEARHDIKAVADPATLTPDEKFWEGIEASRDELADAREALSRAISHNTQEMGETDTERAKLQTALRTARESYRYYRGR